MNTASSNASQGWKDFYKLPRNSVDVVFMGNSHNFETFQPEVINDLIPMESYLLGTSGENVMVSYYELKELLKYQQPRIVVLETFALDLSDLLAPSLMYEFLDASILNPDKLDLWLNYFDLKDAYNLFPALRLRIDWNQPADFFDSFIKTPGSYFNEIDERRGFLPTGRVMLPQEYEESLRLPGRESNYSLENNTHYLKKILDLCRENDIQLVLSVVPPIKIAGEQFEYYVPFDHAAYAEQNRIDIIAMDMADIQPFEYADATHVNAFGSLSLSKQMAQSLSNKLNLTVDQKKLAYYDSFEFAGYQMKLDGNDVTLTLIPVDPAAPLKYRFSRKGLFNFQELATSGWQDESTYSYKLPDEPYEYIEVTIRNTTGDYEMTAEFRYPSDEISP